MSLAYGVVMPSKLFSLNKLIESRICSCAVFKNFEIQKSFSYCNSKFWVCIGVHWIWPETSNYKSSLKLFSFLHWIHSYHFACATGIVFLLF